MPPIAIKDLSKLKEEEERPGPELKMNIFLKKVSEIEDWEISEDKEEEKSDDFT